MNLLPSEFHKIERKSYIVVSLAVNDGDASPCSNRVDSNLHLREKLGTTWSQAVQVPQ